MKNIGKPCAGKPHARFDEGGQGDTCSLLYPEFLVVQKMRSKGMTTEDISEITGLGKEEVEAV